MKIKILVVLLLLNWLTACVTQSVEDSSVPNQKKLSSDDKALRYAQLAKSYMEIENYAAAKEQLDKALSISPNHSASNYIMALLMIKLEQNSEAEKYYRKSVENDSKNSLAMHNFGMFLCQTGKQQESIQYFDQAAANPLFDRPELSYMRAGECLSQLGETNKATRYLKKSLTINAQLRPSLLRLAKINYDDQSYFSARAYIERYLAITKPQPGALLLAYKIESALKADEVASKYKKNLLEDFPGSKAAGTLRKMLGEHGG